MFGNVVHTASLIIPGEKSKGWQEINKGIIGHEIFEGLINLGEGPHSSFFFLQREDHIEVSSNNYGGIRVIMNKLIKMLDKNILEDGILWPIRIEEMTFNSGAKNMKDSR